jgi:fluoroacetyl-CoA thioesterase
MSAAWVGERHELRLDVEDRHSAHAYGNAGLHVLSTPALLGLLEDAALKALAPLLEPGQRSVGVRADFRHLAATPVGAPIVVRAEIETVDEAEVRFAVAAHDAHEPIAEGHHVRFVVDGARFLRRVEAKR